MYVKLCVGFLVKTLSFANLSFLTFYLIGTLKARVLAPISTEGVTAAGVPDLAENVRQQMLKVFLEGDPSKGIKDTVSTEDKKIK